MGTSRRALVPILLLCVLAPAQEQARWTRMQEANFEVYSQGDPREAEPLVQSFEQLRNALAQASLLRMEGSPQLKIIAFHSEIEYNQYRLNAGSLAYYQQTHRGDYIVLPDLDARHRQVSLHEFTHFVVAHSGLTLPLWLNEGLADFYSTYQVSGESVTFGSPVPGRLSVLRSRAWLPLCELFQVSSNSPYYSDLDRMKLFYSESWALAHMFVANPAYAVRFAEFLSNVSAGHSSQESLQLVYGKTIGQVEEELHAYLKGAKLPLIQARLTAGEKKLPASAAPSTISNSEMDINLADLALTSPGTRASVESRLSNAASELSENSEPEEALGYLALREGDLQEARDHFRKAAARNSRDPKVLFYLAHLDHVAGETPDRIIPLLERSLALSPDLNDARLELVLVEAEIGDYETALADLRKVRSFRPENAYAVAYTEAYCYAYTDRFAEARKAAEYAKSLATGEHDRAEVTRLLEYIDQQE